MSALPFVQVCMPTTARRRDRLPNAIRAWQAQDYPSDRWRMLVVEDGPGTVRDLVPDNDPRIVWGRLEGECTLGAKYNAIFAQAPDDAWVIAAGDDDFVSPMFLRWLVSNAVEHQVDIVGGLSMMVWSETRRSLFLYAHHAPIEPDDEGRVREISMPYLIGGTALMHRRHWNEYRFPDVQSSSDSAQVRGVLTLGAGPGDGCVLDGYELERGGYVVEVRRRGVSQRYVALTDPRHYLAVTHGNNTGNPFEMARCAHPAADATMGVCGTFLRRAVTGEWTHPISATACPLAGGVVSDPDHINAGSDAPVWGALPEGYTVERWAKWMGEDIARAYGIIP